MMNTTYRNATKHAIQISAWNSLIRDFGMEIDGPIGTLKFLNRCFIRKGPGVHMELRGIKGVVNVLIMDGEYVTERIATGNDSMDWVLIPCPIGSMAIIGNKYEDLDRIEQLLDRTIRWHQPAFITNLLPRRPNGAPPDQVRGRAIEAPRYGHS